MALIAEELVEEWLNQQKYFTIRNLKSGQNEIDLLGVKLNGKSKNQLVHVEVMVSHSPMSWICRINLKGAYKGKQVCWNFYFIKHTSCQRSNLYSTNYYVDKRCKKNC